MGCDIHAHIEIKVDDEWLYYAPANIQRDYRVFEKMAGVRGELRFAISPPKGIPKDASKMTLLHAQNAMSYKHSDSWLSYEEYVILIDYLTANYPSNRDFDWEHSFLGDFLYLFDGS